MFWKTYIEETDDPHVHLLIETKAVNKPILKLTLTNEKKCEDKFDAYIVIPYKRGLDINTLLIGVNILEAGREYVMADSKLARSIRFAACNYYIQKFTNSMWNDSMSALQRGTQFIKGIYRKDYQKAIKFYQFDNVDLTGRSSPNHRDKYFTEKTWPYYLECRTIYNKV